MGWDSITTPSILHGPAVLEGCATPSIYTLIVIPGAASSYRCSWRWHSTQDPRHHDLPGDFISALRVVDRRDRARLEVDLSSRLRRVERPPGRFGVPRVDWLINQGRAHLGGARSDLADRRLRHGAAARGASRHPRTITKRRGSTVRPRGRSSGRSPCRSSCRRSFSSRRYRSSHPSRFST